MINISIYNPEKYEFDEKAVISEVERTVKENLDFELRPGMKTIEISVAVVAHKDLVKIAGKYFTDEIEEELNEHPVLSFVYGEVEREFINPPDGVDRLGEIIISWEKAERSSAGIVDLAVHGTLHLLGIHHN